MLLATTISWAAPCFDIPPFSEVVWAAPPWRYESVMMLIQVFRKCSGTFQLACTAAGIALGFADASLYRCPDSRQ